MGEEKWPSDGPKKIKKDRGALADFADLIYSANGDWVEIKMPTRGAYASVLRSLGLKVAEVTQEKGILYGRMRERS